ncbi:MAG TPA: competence/damage-inducible protein A [Candidatus Aminicenantes bacterium]|nr:competence/damage-inducible protein A [Candidatus Aminicenantes bacterium]HRY65210.1 competence/damage-inducible protein A [Candidatus Aminicenantes bacterium]HRZ72322.1 competence/damage-inducible protein A [Candidatus Aminicenantes bacterium]
MRIEIVAVGSELVTPDFMDTNSLRLTAGLNDIGLGVAFKTVVGDKDRDLASALRTALARADLVLCMGGLGPTEDDRTRETLARVLRRRLVFRASIREKIRERFRRRGWPMAASNLKQCYVIAGAEVLDNPNGTAPGQWVETRHNRIALLPGPPHEILPMFEKDVLPRLKGLGRGLSARRVIRLTGLGESAMEMRLKPVYARTPSGVTVTTLAVPGDLSIRLTYTGAGPAAAAEARLDELEAAVERAVGPWIYSRDGRGLEEVVGGLLRERGLTIACAESCTGGLIGHRLTEVPGSSDYFLESAVTYSNRAKTKRLGVPAALIERCGAVSAPVARAMALGIRRTSGADIGLAVTGVAGPGGGTARKPVGLVYIAVAGGRGAAVERCSFAGGRSYVKFQSSQKALDLVRKSLRPRPAKAL